MTITLSVVIAVKGDEANLPAVVEALPVTRHPDVEYLFCFAGKAAPEQLVGSHSSIRILEGVVSDLVPHLWRDGIREAVGPKVALTTASCIPAPDWVQKLKEADTDRWPGIGGCFALHPAASKSASAVFFLRYSAFMTGGASRDATEIAADNAVYRRDAILLHDDLLSVGFWEPSFHARFREAGWTMRLDPMILVSHRGGEASRTFAAHRFRHGRQFGRDRVREKSAVASFALVIASPLVPLVTMMRIVSRVGRRPRYWLRLLQSLPWLGVFIIAWSAGEARGYLDGAFARLSRSERRSVPGAEIGTAQGGTLK